MISRRSILTQALWLAAGAGGAWLIRDRLLWPGPTAAFDPGDEASGWQDFAIPRQLLPIVQVSVRGAPLDALLDSGAERSAIDSAVAARLGLDKGLSLPVVAFGVGGGAEVGRSASLDVELGGLALKGLQVASLDLGPIASARGLGAGLVLGQDVLRRVIAEIDFPARRLRFHDRQAFVAPDDMTPLPVTRAGGALQVAVRVDGVEVQAVIDTGA